MSPYRPEPTVPNRGSLWVPFGLLVAMAVPFSTIWVLTPIWVPPTFNGGHERVVTEGVYFAGLMFAAVAVFMDDHGDYGGTEPSYFKQAPYRALLIFSWWPIFMLGLGVVIVSRWAIAFVRWFRNGGFQVRP